MCNGEMCNDASAQTGASRRQPVHHHKIMTGETSSWCCLEWRASHAIRGPAGRALGANRRQPAPTRGNPRLSDAAQPQPVPPGAARPQPASTRG
jgi:hypothetical protein